MGARAPGRRKLGPTGQQTIQARRRALLHHQAEPLQRGRIDPVQVFDDEEHRLLLGLRQQPGQQGFEGFLLLPLGRQREGRILCRQRQREQRGKQRHHLWQRPGMPRQGVFQLLELLLRDGVPLPGQHPLQMGNHGSERTVLVIGGTAVLDPRMRFLRHLVLQGLDQA